jgi:polyhydroxybutyrate depolymerase
MNRNTETLVRAIYRRVIIILLFLVQPLTAYAELLTDLTIEHDGITRSYDLHVPGNAGEQPAALVLDLHGLFLDKTTQRGYSRFDTVAEQEGFYVAFPDAINRAWNVEVGSSGADDVGFLRALVARIISQYNIDPNRIYASGHSRGGGMVYRLACEAADLFAAYSTVAIAATILHETICNPGRPVPVLSVHGLTDRLVAYEGDGFFLSAADNLEFWRGKNNCNGPVERENFGSEAWCDIDRLCQDDVQTAMCTVTGGGGDSHVIYRNTAGLDLAELSWDFFQLFTLAGVSPGFEINAGLNDAWVSADAPLQGFFFTVFPDLKFFFLSWFTFDSLPPGSGAAIFGSIDQRWVTGGGFYSGDSVPINVELTSGGTFNSTDPLATQQPGYGTITIVFNSCTEAVLTYNFPSVGLSGEITLTRVLVDNVALCEVLAEG